jgi:hypothetical protein
MTSTLIASNIQITVRLIITKRGTIGLAVPYPLNRDILNSLKEVGAHEVNSISINMGQGIRRVYPEYETILVRTHPKKYEYDFTFNTKSLEPVPG